MAHAQRLSAEDEHSTQRTTGDCSCDCMAPRLALLFCLSQHQRQLFHHQAPFHRYVLHDTSVITCELCIVCSIQAYLSVLFVRLYASGARSLSVSADSSASRDMALQLSTPIPIYHHSKSNVYSKTCMKATLASGRPVSSLHAHGTTWYTCHDRR